MRVFRKSHMILLEVLIALALLALCVLPLVAPHFTIVKSHIQFNHLLEVDRIANQLYVDFLERLHKHEIAWSVIQNEQYIPIEDSVWWRLIPDKKEPLFAGTYQFQEIKHKENKETGWGVYLLRLNLALNPLQAGNNAPPNLFTYTITVLRHVAGTEPEKKESKE